MCYSFTLQTQRPHLAKLWLLAACVTLCFGPGAEAIKCQVCKLVPERSMQCWPRRSTCTIKDGYCLQIITIDAETDTVKHIRRNCISKATKMCRRKFLSDDRKEIYAFACCDENGCLMPHGMVN
ncbi:Hypothetical predicted protein [Podarcis lilfordi]|nr:Hypothetical predicted protein [Podarcis lilfordi]